jgi:hypothetical protein
LFFLFFSSILFLFATHSNVVISLPLLAAFRSLPRSLDLRCCTTQTPAQETRRAYTLSPLSVFCVAAWRKVSRPNPRCPNLRSQTHVLIHALRILGLKLTSWSTLSESYVSTNPRPIPRCQNLTSQNPRTDPCCQNLMSQQIQVLFHTVRIFGSQTHMLIHAVQNLRSQSHVLIHTIRILGLKPMS